MARGQGGGASAGTPLTCDLQLHLVEALHALVQRAAEQLLLLRDDRLEAAAAAV